MKTIDITGIGQLTFTQPVSDEWAYWLELYVELLQESVRLGGQLGEVTFTQTHPDLLGQMTFTR